MTGHRLNHRSGPCSRPLLSLPRWGPASNKGSANTNWKLHKPVAGGINAFTETSGIGGPSPGKLIFVAEIMQIGSIRLSVGKSGFPESR